MIQYLMLHFLNLYYLLLHSLILYYVNEALFYVALLMLNILVYYFIKFIIKYTINVALYQCPTI